MLLIWLVVNGATHNAMRNRKFIGYTLAPLKRDHQSFFNSLKLLVVYKYIGH